MRLNEVDFGATPVVEGYGLGFFRIGGQVIQGALLAGPRGFGPWAGDAAALLDLVGEIDVVLYGTGGEVAHVPDGLRAALEAAGIGVEPMASASACRTYNVLLGEGRRVALAALAV